MHQIERGIDLIQTHDMCNHWIDLDLTGHVHINDFGHIGPALGTAEGRAAPVAPRDKLERAGADFLARFGNTNDDRGASAAMTRL